MQAYINKVEAKAVFFKVKYFRSPNQQQRSIDVSIDAWI